MMLNYFKRLGSPAIYIWWKNAQLSMISHQMRGGDKVTMNMEEAEWNVSVCEMEWVWNEQVG